MLAFVSRHAMQAEFSRVDISRNGRSGVIALDGALLELSACTVSDNRKYGLELQVCTFFPVLYSLVTQFDKGCENASTRCRGLTFFQAQLCLTRAPVH